MSKRKLLLFFFLFCYGAIIVKLFFIQIISTEQIKTDNYLQTEMILAERGSIYDRNRHPLVLNQNSYHLYIEPKEIKDKYEVIKKLDEVLKLGEATIEARFDDTKYWVSILSGIEEKEKDKISKYNLKGVGFNYSLKRYYPEASLAAHLVGFVGKNEKAEDIGYFGLEGFYDKELKGIPGLLESERDLLGRPILIGTQEKIDPENGRDLILTIDKTIQDISKQSLLNALEEYKARQGCIITADPYTMQILGLVCLPDFDLEKYYEFSEDSFKNAAISDLYEPGSIFKPIIVSYGILNKLIKPDDIFDEKGPIKIGQYSIRTWNNEYQGKITVSGILEKSSNVGMVQIGQKMGNKAVFNAISDFGFGNLTNIDLQGEVSGNLKPINNWYSIDFATVTFGQGIAVTPIQMLTSFAAIINGGNLLKPYVVYKMDSGDREIEIKPKVIRKVLNNKTSEIMKKMLYSTVEHGEFQWVKPVGYKMGGKTGTAQIPIQGHYDTSKTIASFIGFAPLDKPKFITLIVLNEPESSPWASETAAPLFFKVAKEFLIYYNVAPEE